MGSGIAATTSKNARESGVAVESFSGDPGVSPRLQERHFRLHRESFGNLLEGTREILRRFIIRRQAENLSFPVEESGPWIRDVVDEVSHDGFLKENGRQYGHVWVVKCNPFGEGRNERCS